MNAWMKFTAVPIVLLLLAYFSLSTVNKLIPNKEVIPVSIEKVKLPTAIIPVPARIEEINYAAFGMQAEIEVAAKPKPKPKRIKFTLTSVLMSDTGRVAVINGEIVQKGAKLKGGYRVKQIKSREVVLSRWGKTRTLRFPETKNKPFTVSHAIPHQ